MILTLSFDAFNKDLDKRVKRDDGSEIWIASYIPSPTTPSNPDPPDETANLFANITGNTNLKAGYSRTYSVNFTDKDGAPLEDVDFEWNVESDFTDEISQSVSGNTIKLSVGDDSLIGESFLLSVLVDGEKLGDIEQRYRSYNIGINSGILSPNECRMMENRNKRPGGDIYLAPLNMVDSTNGMPSAESQGGEEEQNKGINFNLVPITAGNKASAQDEYLSEHMLARERLRSDFAPRYLVRAKAMVKHEIAEIRQRVASGMPLPHAIVAAYADMPAWIKDQFADLVREYAIKVRDASLLEAGAGALDTFVFSEFIDQLLDGLATGHSYDGHNQLMALINDQLIDDSQAAVEARMEEWAATRADKFAGREPVEHESAISRFVWAAVGVTALKWQTRGNKTCPFCAALNGKIVGIDKPFLEPGAFEPPGHEQSALKVRGPRLHAPIHRGCVCMIVPVTE